MGFRLVPKSVTLNDLERRNDRYLAFFRRIPQLSELITSKWLKIDLYSLRRKCSPKNLVFSDISWRYSKRLPRTSTLLIGTCAIYIHFSIMTRLKVSLCCRFDSTIRLQCKTLISILCSSRTVSLRQLSFLFLHFSKSHAVVILGFNSFFPTLSTKWESFGDFKISVWESAKIGSVRPV